MSVVNVKGVSPYKNVFGVNNAKNVRNVQSSKVDFRDFENDTFINSTSQTTENQPIKLKEGVKIFANGFKGKLKSIVTSIVKHPIKTAAIALGTTALMMALPLVGISTVAAGSALTLLYAGIAVGKTAVDTVKFVKNNKNGEYDEARKNLSSMGGDTLDLAITLPFVPKAVKNVKDFAKYGQIGVNHELISEMKNAGNLKDKVNVLKQGNVKILEDVNYKREVGKICSTPEKAAEFEALRKLPKREFTQKIYEKITEEMGMKDVAPKFTMSDSMASNILGGFNPADCSIQFNATEFETMNQSEIIDTVRHELEHFQQYSDIARYKGPEYIVELEARSYTERVKRGDTGLFDFSKKARQKHLQEIGEEAFVKETKADLSNQINVQAYRDVVNSQGRILEGTPEALKAEQYIEASLNYPDTSFMLFGPSSEYTNNLLEVNARQAGENPGGFAGDYKTLTENLQPVKDTTVQDIAAKIAQGEVVLQNN